MKLLGILSVFIALNTVTEGKTLSSNVGTFNRANPPVVAEATPNPDPFLGFKPDPDPTKRGDSYGKYFYQRNMLAVPYKQIGLPPQSSAPPTGPQISYPSYPTLGGIPSF